MWKQEAVRSRTCARRLQGSSMLRKQQLTNTNHCNCGLCSLMRDCRTYYWLIKLLTGSNKRQDSANTKETAKSCDRRSLSRKTKITWIRKSQERKNLTERRKIKEALPYTVQNHWRTPVISEQSVDATSGKHRTPPSRGCLKVRTSVALALQDRRHRKATVLYDKLSWFPIVLLCCIAKHSYYNTSRAE